MFELTPDGVAVADVDLARGGERQAEVVDNLWLITTTPMGPVTPADVMPLRIAWLGPEGTEIASWAST